MVKNFVKFMLCTVALFSYFQLIGEEQTTLPIEEYLQPLDLDLLEQDQPMVFITPDVVDVLTKMNSNNQIVKDLIEHVKLGYSVASESIMSEAMSCILNSKDISKNNIDVLATYQEAVRTGAARINQIETPDRRNKSIKACSLCVQGQSKLGPTTIKGNLNVCGNISASNFTSFTGVTGGILVPGIVAQGNILFNAGGANELFAQGAIEPFLENIRGTIQFSNSAITLASSAPGTIITVGGLLPNVSVVRGTGITLGAVIAGGASELTNTTTAAGIGFYFQVKFSIPVTFDTPYIQPPTAVLGYERVTTGVDGIVDANSLTTAEPAIQSVTDTDVQFNFIFNIFAEGATYDAALANAAISINEIFASGRSINFLCQGPVN